MSNAMLALLSGLGSYKKGKKPSKNTYIFAGIGLIIIIALGIYGIFGL